MGGVAKPLLEVGGRAILDRLVDALTPLVAEIFVAVADPAQAPPGLRAVVDAAPGPGRSPGSPPPGRRATRPWLVAIAGDMPYVTRRGRGRAARPRRARGRRGRAAHRHAAPARAAARRCGARRPGAAAARRLAAGRYKTSGLLTDEDLRVAWLDEADLRAVDPDLRCLVNVNRPEDLP